MSIYEYDEERHMRQTREEGVAEGYANGVTAGITQVITQGITQITGNLIKSGILTDTQISEITGLNQEKLEELRKKKAGMMQK